VVLGASSLGILMAFSALRYGDAIKKKHIPCKSKTDREDEHALVRPGSKPLNKEGLVPPPRKEGVRRGARCKCERTRGEEDGR